MYLFNCSTPKTSILRMIVLVFLIVTFLSPLIAFLPYVNQYSLLIGTKYARGNYCSVSGSMGSQTLIRLHNLNNICPLYESKLFILNEFLDMNRHKDGDRINCAIWYTCNPKDSHLPMHVVPSEKLSTFRARRICLFICWFVCVISSFCTVAFLSFVFKKKDALKRNGLVQF